MNVVPLIAAAGLMGLAGLPHCTAMCAAPCAAVVRGCGGAPGAGAAFQTGRWAGYAAAGAVVASGASWLQQWLSIAPVLQPLWALVHLAALALGLWMLAQGRLPVLQRSTTVTANPLPVGWQRVQGPARAAAAGAAWIAWPCALSQSALLLAALGSGAWQGAAAMSAFALASSPGLVAAPWVLARLQRLRPTTGTNDASAWPIRGAGLMLAAGSAWALGHGLWTRVAALCAS
jgi:sulfite exporter TauE/SafE